MNEPSEIFDESWAIETFFAIGISPVTYVTLYVVSRQQHYARPKVTNSFVCLVRKTKADLLTLSLSTNFVFLRLDTKLVATTLKHEIVANFVLVAPPAGMRRRESKSDSFGAFSSRLLAAKLCRRS